MSGAPRHDSYDVVIVGGAMYGSSVAWWLTWHGFDGRILVVERDPSYEFSSTAHTNSCIRQQFSNETNIRISQFGAKFMRNFKRFIGDDEAPEILLQSYGYMYMADTPDFAATLKAQQAVQAKLGAGTRHMSRDQIAAEYPFYFLDDILAANHNPVDEGYFDGGTIFDWWRKKAKANGVEYLHDEVVGIARDGNRVTGVRLAGGENIACGVVVNCSGPRAARVAAMAGIAGLPVEPRKRYTYIFKAEEPLDRDLPLTIDPSGVHMRQDGRDTYLAGGPPDDDPAVEPDDFGFDHGLWEAKIWPAIAARVPAFERVKVINQWVGHYAYNTFDQNAIIGPHDEVANFIFANGFSGHGLQQSPALGRGLAEWICFGEYREIDLAPFGYGRIRKGETFLERAVI